MKVSAVVPVYNSEASLPSLVEQLAAALEEACAEHEIVLVDDGSSDASWAQIVSVAARFPQVVGIRLANNVGEHHALLCGIRAARFGVVVTLDDDLQNPPSEIPILLEQIEAGHDLVYGVPDRMRHTPGRRVAARLWKGIASLLLGRSDARSVSSFRAFRTTLRDEFAEGPDQAIFLDDMLSWGASDPAFASVRHSPRAVGRSTYRLGTLVDHTFDMVTNYSVLPLRLASLLGAALLVAAPLLAAVGALRRDDGDLSSWLLAAFVALVGGAILLVLGIVGEYLGRLFERSTHRPPYVVAAVHPAPGEEIGAPGIDGSEAGGERHGRQVGGARSEAT